MNTADKLWEIAGASFTRLIADSELEGKSSYTNMGQNNPFGTLNEHSSVEENQENSSQENECVDDNELDPKIKMLKYMGIDISLFTDG
ncbi:hypothetical protein H4219_001105 [Mycoemilia scoparia]|uniref:Uncharacterized protein n=1 Tax=Mycoemilia scoparia TaxID=417184 RepID=A0A9W8DQQ9_9FUNG|nr:hypothetical protein H4219_001105 [Mycoemilia scoparia]